LLDAAQVLVPIALNHALYNGLKSIACRLCVFALSSCRLLVPLLPLVVHTLHSVRRAVSRVLALTLFGSAAQQWSGFASAAAAAAADAAASAGLETSAWPLQQQQQDGKPPPPQQQQQQAVLLPGGVGGVLLPEPFLQQYKFPFKVVPVSVTAAATEPDSSCQNVTEGPSMQSAEHQQQRWVKQLVEQQQLLRLAGDNPAAARAMLADCLPPAAHHISQAVLSATANQLFNVDAAAVAQRLLAAVQASGSHAECEQALQQLEQLASSHQGLQAIAAAGNTPNTDAQHAAVARDGQDCIVITGSSSSCGWQSAFDRLLGAAPINREDQRLWLCLLQLLERMLVAAPLAEVGGLAWLDAVRINAVRCRLCVTHSVACIHAASPASAAVLLLFNACCLPCCSMLRPATRCRDLLLAMFCVTCAGAVCTPAAPVAAVCQGLVAAASHITRGP
jgi:hypothetical protein